MKKIMKKIGLQFFAEEAEAPKEEAPLIEDSVDNDDFEDDFDDVPEYYGWDHADEDEEDVEQAQEKREDADESAEQDNGAEESADGADTEAEQDAEDEENDETPDESADGEDTGEEDAARGEAAQDGNAELIAELQALGYIGDDLASLTADIKRRREDAEKNDASNERRARAAAGKLHITSAKPQKNVGGDGSGGFTSKQVRNLQQTLGCSYERARELLSKQVRAIG